MRHIPKFDPERVYPVIDGPLKGEWRMSQAPYFYAAEPPPVNLAAFDHNGVAAPVPPMSQKTVRYTLNTHRQYDFCWAVEVSQ